MTGSTIDNATSPEAVSTAPLDLATHYIPLDRDAVIKLCGEQLEAADRGAFDRLAKILSAWYHHQFLDRTQALKQLYLQQSPQFGDQLGDVVTAANFSEITRDDLDRALLEESLFQLRLAVDFNDFKEVVFYRRGASRRSEEVKKWYGLGRKVVEFTNFDLVLVFVRLRDLKPGEEARDLPFTPGESLLKLFANVPQSDLEMLFPNTQVRMRLIDKLLIGVPAFVSGMIVLTTKIGGTLLLLAGVFAFWLGLSGEPVTLNQTELIALVTAAATLGGYLWKQYSNFKNRKIRFMKTLTESLYFRTLAHNEGVLSYLIDKAEEAEIKEALLAYTGLRVLGSATSAELTEWVNATLDHATHFDVEDALNKLKQTGLLIEGERLAVVGPEEGFTHLDAKWDALFGA